MCFALGEAYAIAAGVSVLVIGLILLAALFLSVLCDRDGTAMFFFRKTRWRSGIPLMLIFAAVAAMGYLNVQTVSRQEMLASVIGNEAVAMGHMNCHIYDMRRNGAGWQVYVYAESVEVNEVSYSGNTRVLIYTDNVDGLRIGQSLTVTGEFYRPDIADNPGQFDARTYYAHKGIYVMCRALNIDSSGSYSYVGDMLFRLRQLASGALADYFDEGDASVIRAMLLGEKSGLDSDTKRLFQMNGIAHILAISGVHIAIVGMSLYKLLRRLTGSYAAAGCMASMVVIMYGVMTGLASSAFRAVTMMIIAVAGRALGRSPDMLTSAGIAAVIQAVVDPGIIMDAGFQLSFAAVVGMAVIVPMLRKLIPFRNTFADTIMVDISVSIATTPIVIYYFYQFPLYALVVNLLIVPLVSVLLLCSIVVIAAGIMCQAFAWGWFGDLAGIMACPVTQVLSFYRYICRFAAGLPYSSINTGHISEGMLIVFYVSVILCLRLAIVCRERLGDGGHRRFVYLAAVVAVCAAGIVYECAAYDDEFRIIFMDVGQGDGILVRSGDGINILIDGGSSDNRQVGEYVMAPVIRYYGAADIDYAFVTHGDNDHISGIQYLLETADTGITIRNLVIPRYGNLEEMEDIIAAAVRSGVNVMYVEVGDIMSGGVDMAKIELRVLHPGAKTDIKDENELSMVLKLEYREKTVLFTGDLGESGEHLLLGQGADVGADVLKVGHHGSRYSSTEDFIMSVAPSVAVISAGSSNRYGHPHSETLERLDACGAGIMSTIEHGAVCVCITDDCLAVTGYR